MNKFLRTYVELSTTHLRIDGAHSNAISKLCKEDSFYLIVEETSDKGKIHTHAILCFGDATPDDIRDWVKEHFNVTGSQFAHSKVENIHAVIRYLCKDNDVAEMKHKGITIEDLERYKRWAYKKYSKKKFMEKLEALEYQYYMEDLRFEKFVNRYVNLKLNYNQTLGTGAENYLLSHYYKKVGVNQWCVNFFEKKNLY